MSEAPNIDVGNKGEMDGTNTTATDTTGGLETIAPVLDFTDGEESAVLDRQVVELVTDDVRLAGNAEIKLDLVPVPGLYLHGVFDDPRSALAHMAGFAPPESISLFDAKGQRINGVPAGNTWSADGILKLKWRLLPEPVSVDGDDATRMTQLAAHVFNLEMHLWQGSPGKPGLLELEHGPWKGRIKTLKQDPERSRDLRLTGGYRLTHVVEFDQGGGCFSGPRRRQAPASHRVLPQLRQRRNVPIGVSVGVEQRRETGLGAMVLPKRVANKALVLVRRKVRRTPGGVVPGIHGQMEDGGMGGCTRVRNLVVRASNLWPPRLPTKELWLLKSPWNASRTSIACANGPWSPSKVSRSSGFRTDSGFCCVHWTYRSRFRALRRR